MKSSAPNLVLQLAARRTATGQGHWVKWENFQHSTSRLKSLEIPAPGQAPSRNNPRCRANYAGSTLIKGIEGHSGRDALLTLEEILRSRPSQKSAQGPSNASAVKRAG